MLTESDLDALSEGISSAREALVAALDAIQQAVSDPLSASYVPRDALGAVKNMLQKVEHAEDDPTLLLGNRNADRLEEASERLIRVLRDSYHLGPDDSTSALYCGYLGDAVRQLAAIPTELVRLREKSLILTEDAPLQPNVITALHAAADVLLERIGPDPREWLQLGSRRFEEILAEIWTGLGWQTFLTPPARDGGFDIRAIRDANGTCLCYLVEAKAYRPDRPVGIAAVRHLYGIVERERATHGVIATTSTFTRDAIAEAEAMKYRLTLADFRRVLDWLQEYRRIRQYGNVR